MSVIANTKIRTKLVVAFLAVAAIIAVVAFIGWNRTAAINAHLSDMYDNQIVPSRDLDVISSSMVWLRREEYAMILMPSERAIHERKLAEVESETATALADYRKRDLTREEQTQLAEYVDASTELTKYVDSTKNDITAGRTAAAIALFGNSGPMEAARLRSRKAIDELRRINGEAADKNKQQGAKAYSDSVIFLLCFAVAGLVLALSLGILIANSIAGPLAMVVSLLKDLGQGKLGGRLKLQRQDEIGELARTTDAFAEDLQLNLVATLQKMAAGDMSTALIAKSREDEITPAIKSITDSLNSLTHEMSTMSAQHDAGDIDVKISAEIFKGDFRTIAEGVNKMVFGHIEVKKKAMACIAEFGKGNFEATLEIFPGKKVFINNTIEQLRSNLQRFIKEMSYMSAQHDLGDIDVKISAETFQGDFNQMAEGVNKMVFGHIEVKKKAMACIAEFGKGNFEATLEIFPGKKFFINNTIEQLRSNLLKFIKEMSYMSAQHDLGDIDVKISAETFQGDFNKMADGVNKMVFGHIEVKKKAMACIAEFGKGNFEAPLETFPGKKVFINNTIEQLRFNLHKFIEEMSHMSTQHDLGDIDVKISAETFQGDFNKMADGVNKMVFGHIEVKKKAMTCIAEFGKGNFEAPLETFPGKKVFINNTIEQVRANLKALIADTEMLAAAAVQGKLSTRADASKHHGDFRKIVQGIDDTLDAVINPLNVTANYVDKISKGDIPGKITEHYNGDFNTIKNNLNNCVDGLAGLVEANEVLQKMAANNLSVRVEGRYLGIFAELAKAINTTVVNQAQVLRGIQLNAESLAQSSEGLTTSSTAMANNSEAMTTQANTAAAATEQASISVKNMAAGIEQVSANSQSVATASQQISVNLDAVGASVEQMSATMKSVAATSESMTGAVNSVAAAIEEMSASLNEVSKNTGQAALVSGRAAKSANTTAVIVNKLGTSAIEIGKVVEIIKGIAAQTNLLALNATIEAASAGEAGKGFAVVANEVKELAKQTASATEDIRNQVSAMQENTSAAVKAIEEIVGVINEISGISSTIAAAVEEQTATTNEIARNVGNAARGATEVTRNVNESAQGASVISLNVQEAARGVSAITKNMNQLATGANDVARNASEAAKGVNEVAKNVSSVSERSKQTTKGATDTNASAVELGMLAESLKTAVTSFRIQ